MGMIVRCLVLGVIAICVMGQASCSDTNEVPTSYGGDARPWTAYAYDSKNGAWGLGWGQSSRKAAMNQALGNCRYSGCVVQEVTQSRCVAVARSDRPLVVTFGRAETEAAADNYALGFCRRSSAYCHIQAVRCS